MNWLSAGWKFLMELIRDFANGQIDPNWKAKQEELQRDAAAHQRQHAATEKENTIIESGVEQRESEIVANTGKETVIEAGRIAENERIEKAESIEDVLFGK